MSENYRFDFTVELLNFPEYITWLTKLNSDELGSIVSRASCIMIHDSIDSKEDKEHLLALAKKKGITYCIFSNRFSATLFEGSSIKEIKKDRMYNNLLSFIINFKKHKIIDLGFVALGQNYKIEKALIIQERLALGTLFENRKDFNYEVAFPSGSQHYNDLITLYNLAYQDDNFSLFEETFNRSDTTVDEIINQINLLVKQIAEKNV